jgi:hypothetical protein
MRSQLRCESSLGRVCSHHPLPGVFDVTEAAALLVETQKAKASGIPKAFSGAGDRIRSGDHQLGNGWVIRPGSSVDRHAVLEAERCDLQIRSETLSGPSRAYRAKRAKRP